MRTLVLLVSLVLLLVACAARPLPLGTTSKQARVRATSRALVYRRTSDLQPGRPVLDDAVAAMGASCVRVPFASITSSSGTSAGEAADGDVATTFNSGAFGPHALTLDLAEAQQVSGIVIATEQTPDGVTTQVVEASDDGVTWSELGALRGHTTTETVYSATVRPALRTRFVRVRTTESPSWVAFREVVLVSCTAPARVAGDRVPRRSPVDRSGSRWVRGHGACERPSDCVMDDCCAARTCVARAEGPRCVATGCARLHPDETVECSCRASTCGAWVTSPGLSPLGERSVSPGDH